jgi:toxin ParE1/3/4
VPHKIKWHPDARNDLYALYLWIAEQADDDIAYRYTARIEKHTQTLTQFPARGTPRDDLVAGLRTITYRRRTIITYQIVGHVVEILGIIHGGRDLKKRFVSGE